jgi:hypothetical protein
MRSNSDDETLVESVATVEQANEPDKSKDLAHRLFSDTIIFCIAVVFVVVVTTLAVLLHNSSSSDATTNTEQQSEAPPLPGPTTMAPTFGGVLLDPTAIPFTAPPTPNPSTTLSEQPVDPSCQVDYPSIPIFTCFEREEQYGQDAIGYQFAVDCDAYGDYQAQTGLWESGRTMGTVFDNDGVKLQLSLGEDSDGNYNTSCNECWLSFLLETDVTPSCVRIQLHDDLCSAFYTSDCIALATCPWG